MSRSHYEILPNEEFQALQQLMVNTTLQLAGLTAIFVMVFLYMLFILMGRPLGVLSLHVDALSRGEHDYLQSRTPGFYLVSEFNKLRLSLNDYINQIEKLENIANGNLNESSQLDSELDDEASGLMLSFNNVVKQLKKTIEEKDHVSLLLQEKANELQKASEAASSANKAKSIFLANMSHEIRTPLTAIIGFAEASLDKEQTLEERLDALKIIVKSGRHLLQIINDILDLSKVEAHKLVIERLPISPIQILTEVESIVKIHALEKNLDFRIIYFFPLPTKIYSDPIRIKQILLNLCNNAIKFTQSGHVNLHVSCNLDTQSLIFDIIDTGVGLSEEQIQKIFTPFTQADDSTTRKFGGTGLGLSLSMQLSKMLGGNLSVNSEQGVGSTFTAIIDIGEIDAEQLIHQHSELPSTKSQTNIPATYIPLSGHVLIADDIAENQKLITMYLNKMGISTTVVNNGKSAIEEAESGSYDLIIMDIRMPILDGLEATTQLRKKGFTTPIIALTANAFKEDKEQCISAGFTDYLLKPIDRGKLNNTLAKYLEASPSSAITHMPLLPTIAADDDFTEIRENFVAKLPERISKIEAVINSKNWNEALFLIHSLKGTSGNIGYKELHDFACNLECQITEKKYTDVYRAVDELNILGERIIAGISPPDAI